jgi:hypothetical protein
MGVETENKSDPGIATITFEIGSPSGLLPVPFCQQSAIDYILAALAGGPHEDLGRAFSAMTSVKSYRRLIKRAAKTCYVTKPFRDAFHTAWTVRGFRWRDALNEDVHLTRALRAILEPYQGPGLALFRGEQSGRHDAGRRGLNWTLKREVAAMFARGLCSTCEGGGILITATAPPNAIIAAPGVHSRYLGEDEYVIDPVLLEGVRELQRYPQFK